jgi:hypothetical protein
LITGEFFDGSFSIFGSIKSNNSSSAGSAVWFILDLCLLYLSNGREKLNKIFVTGRPRELDTRLVKYSRVVKDERLTLRT